MSSISLDPKIEQEIIRLTQVDKKNFSPLYEHYKQHILAYFTFRINTIEIAQELTSEVFEKALIGIDNFKWQGISFSAWLYRIARNTLVDYYRYKQKNNTITSDTLEFSDDTNNPSREVELASSEEYLYKTLNELPPRERDIIYMKFFDGYTNKLISSLTGLSETNIGTIICRAMKRLRELYRT